MNRRIDTTAEEIVRKQIDSFNRHDSKELGSRYAASAVVDDPLCPESLQGADAIAKDYAEWFVGFPDSRLELASVLTNGTTFAAEAKMSGTHLGPMVGPTGLVPATNKRVTANIAFCGDVDGQGRIAAERRYYDVAGILGQLGLLQ